MYRNKVSRAFLAITLSFCLIPLAACEGDSTIGEGGVITQSPSCQYEDNLEESASSFISRCRKSGVRREFPSEYNEKTLREIKRDKSADGKKAYKLLNDRRFKK